VAEQLVLHPEGVVVEVVLAQEGVVARVAEVVVSAVVLAAVSAAEQEY